MKPLSHCSAVEGARGEREGIFAIPLTQATAALPELYLYRKLGEATQLSNG
jgi:hypothetical protein